MRVRRGDLRDVYVEDGRAAVFVNEQVIVLSEVAALILQSTPPDLPVTLDHLTAEVVGVIGSPDPPLDAGDIVARQVHDLIAHGILRSEDRVESSAVTAGGVQSLRDALAFILATRAGVWTLAPNVDGDELIQASRRHRVTSTLAAHLDRLSLPAATSARLSASAAQERATIAVLAADLARAIDLLASSGVRCLAFKGLALAAQAHGDPSARGTGDLDLLVSPEDLTQAHQVLTAGGWTPAPGYPVPGGTWAWRHLKHTTYEVSLVGPTSMIDLHWHLSPSRSAFPDFDTLWERSVRVGVLGHVVPTLPPYEALAHSASHAAKDGWGWLRGLVDVHRLVSAPDTWTAADRPLTPDQLVTVGLAARMFGVPAGAPEVVRHAVSATPPVWESVLALQASGSASHEPSSIPGVSLIRSLRTLRLAGASGGDIWRRVSYSAMPSWLTGDQTTRYAAVGVPRVVAKRFASVARNVWAGRLSSL